MRKPCGQDWLFPEMAYTATGTSRSFLRPNGQDDDRITHLENGQRQPMFEQAFRSIADALADLGRPAEIGAIFAGFQQSLYYETAAYA